MLGLTHGNALTPTGGFDTARETNHGDKGKKTFVQVLRRPEIVSFKLLMQSSVNMNGESGFIFMDSERTKVVDDFHYALVLKFSHYRHSIKKIRMNMIKS